MAKKKILKQRDAFIIGEKYSMFPRSDIRFEMEYSDTADSWAFFANHSNRVKIHIRFNSDDLDQEP